jgi:ureidoglycolate lyase
MRIVAEPLTAQAFRPFGTVLEGTPVPGRVHVSDTLASGRPHAPVSLSVATVAPKGGLPLAVTVLERHEHSPGTWHHPLTVLDGPATFAGLTWRDGTAGHEEFVPVTTPLTVVLP